MMKIIILRQIDETQMIIQLNWIKFNFQVIKFNLIYWNYFNYLNFVPKLSFVCRIVSIRNCITYYFPMILKIIKI